MTSAINPLAGRRVLIVEDDYFIAQDMQRSFEEVGAEVLGPVPSIEEALELIAATTDLEAVVLDINLHDGLSYPVADALQIRGMPFVFTTGYEKSALPACYAGVRHFEKPVDAAQIIGALFG
jgi:ActR/RegA family two-component response regulator